MKNKFSLHIRGANHSNELGYPVTIKYKNLNGAFDEAEFNLIHTDFKEPIEKYQKVELRRLNERNITQEVFYGVIVGDSVEKLGRADKYTHNISALEYAFMLDNYISPNITITKNTNPLDEKDFYDPTILEVVNRVIEINRIEHPEMISFVIDRATQAILGAKNSPEWTFEGETLYSILNMLFNYCGVNIKFKDFNTLVHFAPMNESDNDTIDFIGEELTYDATVRNTSLTTDSKNIEIDKSIIEPAFHYSPNKSTDGFEIGPDNLLIPTKLPISNVSGLVISPMLNATVMGTYKDGNTTRWVMMRTFIPSSVIPDEDRNNNLMYGKDRKYHTGSAQTVVEKELYDTFDQTDTITGVGKKLYFETGKTGIYGMSAVAKKKSFWSAQETVGHRLYMQFVGQDKAGGSGYPIDWTAPHYQDPFMDGVDVALAERKIIDYSVGYHAQENKGVVNWELFSIIYVPAYVEEAIRILGVDKSLNTVVDERSAFLSKHILSVSAMNDYFKTYHHAYGRGQSRVEYTPYTSDRVYTMKERNEKTDVVVTQQNYNQTTNVASNESIGNLLDRVSKSNSGMEKTITMLHTKELENIKIGARQKDWVVTGGVKTFYGDHIDALYTFDQYYIRLNHYIGLREKWRQFEIPKEQILRRQITRNMYAKFSNKKDNTESSLIKDINYYLDSDAINNLYIAGPIGDNGRNSTFALSANSYPINNTIISTSEFTSSQVVGTQTVRMNINNTSKFREQAIRLNLPASVNLSFGLQKNILMEAINTLPVISDNSIKTNTQFYSENNFMLESDLRERLAIVLQLHHIDTTGNIFLNGAWSKINGLAGGVGINNSTIRGFALTQEPWTLDFIDNSKVISNQIVQFSEDDRSIRVPVIRNNGNAVANAVAYAREIDGKHEILFWSQETVAPGSASNQYYINFSDLYTNYDEKREYEWIRLPNSVPIVDFEATSFAELPQPTAKHQYGKVFKREWLKENERHKANLGYIKPLYEELPPEDHPDTKAITTGFELESITSEEYEENSRALWVSTNETISDPTFVTDDIRKLDPPKWLETAREQRTEYKPVPTENTPYKNYSTLEELPLTTDSNYKATVTNFTTKKVSKDDWDAGSYLAWNDVQDPGFYTYDSVTRAQLPAPKNTIETARVSNLRWNNDSNNTVTPDYNYFEKESDLPMNILQSNVRATVMNARLETGNSSEWDAGLSVEWARGSVVSSPDYFVKKLSNLPKVDRTGLTAKVENLNWTKVNSPSYDMHELYFWPTFKELDEDSPLDRYDDRPRSGVVTHFDLVRSSISEWDRNISEGKNYKNISLSGSSGHVKTSVWYYFYQQQNQLFNDIGRLSEESYIIRVHSGFGYDWWRAVPTGNGGYPTYYDGIKNPTYYNSVLAQNKMRIDIKTDIFSSPTHEDVWYALERQHRNIFDNLNNAVSQEAMIRYDSGDGGDYYFHIRKDNALGIARKISTVNLQYFKGKLFNSGIRITLTGDLVGEVQPNDVWDLMSNQERQYFESLPEFYLANGIINVNTGHGPNYFKIEPLTDPMQDLQTYAFDKYINRYYKFGRSWSVPRISLKDIPEGAEKDDLWYLLQERESQYFDELDRFEHANGVIHMNNGYTDLYYKLVPVGNTQYNQYYKMGTVIEEYYISKEKL